jgi:cyclopropane-fatty-acyl-phospholipid synthase
MKMPSVADQIGPIVRGLLGGDPAVQIRCWDGSVLGPPSRGTAIKINSPDALRRLLYVPNELGLSRAYVAGDIDIEGDIFEALGLRDQIARLEPRVEIKLGLSGWVRVLNSARALGAVGRPLPRPRAEARPRGRLHSKRRDADAIAHHYDVSNDFYRLVLGPSMTYSCAYFEPRAASLESAQTAKLDLVARKLGLGTGIRLLDVGCGWGSMLLHAAASYDVAGVGVTLSEQQAEFAAKRVAEEGLSDRIEIRLQDYRDVDDGPYDAISSIGMFEHVGVAGLAAYFGNLFALLPPGGRLLNHAISRPPGRASLDKNSFIHRYVFPDGELQEVGSVVTAMQRQGFEVRDVESLREHYALTLRRWVANLESAWDAATVLAGVERARVWRLYMAASALAFEAGRINVHQVLGVKMHPGGSSGMPLTRSDLLAPV